MSQKNMTRRLFGKNVGTIAVLGYSCLNSGLALATVFPQHLPSFPALGGPAQRLTTDVIGFFLNEIEALLTQGVYPPAIDVSGLRGELHPIPSYEEVFSRQFSSEDELKEFFRGEVSKDYVDRRVVHLEGWLLSRTEVSLYYFALIQSELRQGRHPRELESKCMEIDG